VLSSCALVRVPLTNTLDRKLGQGFTSADDLVEVDIGNGDKPRPTFISAKLNFECEQQLTDLLKEYKDCFAWDYTKMPGLDRSIVTNQVRISATSAASSPM